MTQLPNTVSCLFKSQRLPVVHGEEIYPNTLSFLHYYCVPSESLIQCTRFVVQMDDPYSINKEHLFPILYTVHLIAVLFFIGESFFPCLKPWEFVKMAL